MIINKAELTDIRRLAEMRLSYLEEDLGPADQETKEMLRERIIDYLSRRLNSDVTVFTARVDDHIVSCAFLLEVEKPASPSFFNGRTGTVLNVYTEPAYRHRGYGRKVMEALLEDARDKGLCNVELKAAEDGEPLYRSLGFKDVSGEYKQMKYVL